jgi:hypothetical protein
VLQSAATTLAAPTMFSQRLGDEAALTRIFARFARWQAYRCALQTRQLCQSAVALGERDANALAREITQATPVAPLEAQLNGPSPLRRSCVGLQPD